MSNTCKICDNQENNQSYVVKEMMFGFKDEFEYFQCSNCQCLQIKEIPANLDKYYPKDYYSFDQTKVKDNFLKSFLKKEWNRHFVFDQKNIIGALLAKLIGPPPYAQWLKNCKVKIESAILDIGCGSGQLLLELQKAGFKNLTGADPYIEKDIIYPNTVKVFKKDIEQIEGQFDFIMLNHSFEHMVDPLTVLKSLFQLLKQEGCILIRIPVASGYAWTHYRENWVQLDAPRHLFLQTEKSMNILAKKVGLEIKNIVYDSTEFQFWGSEQYQQDIPLKDKRSYLANPNKSIFNKEQIENFKRQAEKLNQEQKGDSAGFYLFKPDYLAKDNKISGIN